MPLQEFEILADNSPVVCPSGSPEPGNVSYKQAQISFFAFPTEETAFARSQA